MVKSDRQDTNISNNAHHSNKNDSRWPKKIDWNSVNSINFWEIADELQDNTLRRANELFAFVEHADLHSLQAILIQYRFFTLYYISDLALLIAKLGNGKIRNFLADI